MLDYAHPRYLFVFEAVIRIIDLTKNGRKREFEMENYEEFFDATILEILPASNALISRFEINNLGWDYGFDLIILIKFDLNVN